MSVSKYRIGEALKSFGSLNKHLLQLTEAEVLACLDLEAASQRRATVISRLISRAARLNEVSFTKALKEKYHGTPQDRSDPR